MFMELRWRGAEQKVGEQAGGRGAGGSRQFGLKCGAKKLMHPPLVLGKQSDLEERGRQNGKVSYTRGSPEE